MTRKNCEFCFTTEILAEKYRLCDVCPFGKQLRKLEMPIVFTLCEKCNKEFQIVFTETVPEYIGVFAVCPYCKHTNHRWLRIPKKET